MIRENLLQQPLFSLWLNPDETAVSAGELVFGGINPARYTGQLQELATVDNSTGGWQTAVDGITVGNQTLEGLQAISAVLDSGTTQIFGSQNDFDIINQVVANMSFPLTYSPYHDAYITPCGDSINGGLPTIGFIMNGTACEIPPSAWINTVAFSAETDPNYHGQLCASSIVPSPPDSDSSPGTTITLRQAFMRQYLTVNNIDPVSLQASSILIAPAAPGLSAA
ncbi:hypothetical protein WJX73_004016 [Symbiochloris irregularis]|uniref:Peptidase A1 domain-containing protein n=1 Tax=Symbiochloris irregularis TaxID=706552 RepID=A0AAW1NPT4_9CHLO